MKILQVCNKMPYPPNDGGAIATLNLTKGFAKLGHQVTILAMNTNKHFFDLRFLPDEYKQIATFIGVETDTNIKAKDALKNLLFSKLPYNAQRFITIDFTNKLAQVLQNEQFDIVQLEGLYLCPYIPVIRKYSKAKIAYRAHNIEHEIWLRTLNQEKDVLKKRYIQILTKRLRNLEINMLNTYDMLIPITERDAQFLNNLGNTKPCFVASSGIEILSKTNPKIETEYPSLFHIGALDWSPNQEGLLWFLHTIWNKIHTKYPKLKLYIAGRNAPDWFVKKIHKSGIHYLGEVENAHDFMHSKAIMIVPLLSGSGMRIKIVEGMSLGKTIVSTSIGAEGIGCTDNENIIIADKPDDFFNSIEKLVTNRELFENIGKNAIKFVNESFDNLKISKSLIEFYKSNPA